MNNKTHWKKLTNPNYLGAYAFDEGKDMILTVASVGNELVTGDGGRKEECTVCHFVENVKPLILNKTNMKSIQKALGTPYIEEWAGHKIQIYVDPKVKFGKEITGGLRVRNYAPSTQKIICQSCGGEIQPRGKSTAQQIAAYTAQKYGQALCAACATRAAAKLREAPNENVDE